MDNGSIHWAIANAVPTLLPFISTTLTCIFLIHVSPVVTIYLISSIHFSPILKKNFHRVPVPIGC